MIWVGDLNYWINLGLESVILNLKWGKYDILLANDQLLQEQMCGSLPMDFEEGEINFGPTYKINEKK